MFTGVRLKAKVKPTVRLVKGISHKHKLAIIYLLAWGPLPAREIVMDVDLPQNLVEHHLKDLLVAGWVTRKRIGREVTYSLVDKSFWDLTKLIRGTPLWNRLQFVKVKKLSWGNF